MIDSNFCQVYLIKLYKINNDGMVKLFVGIFYTVDVFSRVPEKIELFTGLSEEELKEDGIL